MEIIYLISGIVIGGIFTALIYHFFIKSKYPVTAEEWESEQEKQQDLEVRVQLAEKESAGLKEDVEILKRELDEEREKTMKYSSVLAAKNEELKGLNEKLENQKKEIAEMQKTFEIQFRNLANEILEEKTKKFTDQNKVNLKDILTPLREKLVEFEKKVEGINKEGIERNSALKEQIESLKEMNRKITQEAENLTKALKGQTKTQGNWGEFILESILERSGLKKGEQYEIQVSRTTDDGRRLQPDVIVKLPEEKQIIIDSKVSLIAYEKYVNSETDREREEALKNHLISIRSHIKELSAKNYQNLYDIGSLDFVLLFMPIEPAFSLAVQHDPNLFTDAYDKNIVIVSPTTLIATLRTIASIWRQENQNRNALEIARQGGLLYDKFKAFTDDLIKVGENLATTKRNYDSAMNKLSTGKDNLIRKTERLKELGAKANKTIDKRLIDRSGEG